MHRTKLQQRLLDDLVDIVVTVSLFSLLFLGTSYAMGHGFTPHSLFDKRTGPVGTLTTNAYGGSVQEIFRQPKNITSFNATDKISPHLYSEAFISMNMKFPDTMPREVGIASSESRNVSSTIFDVRNIMNIISLSLDPNVSLLAIF